MRLPGTVAWFVHRLSGIVLFLGLGIHFYVMHFSSEENLTYEAVMSRFHSPGWITFNVLFLVSACYHGLHGLWGITLEHVRSERCLGFARYALSLAGTILVAVGIYILSLD